MEESIPISGLSENVVHQESMITQSSHALNLSLAKIGPLVTTVVGGAVTVVTLLSAAVIVTILVSTATPLPPNPHNDFYDNIYKNGIFDLEVLNNDEDPRGLDLSIASFTDPLFGRVELLPNEVVLRYHAPPFYSGPVEFNYTVTNGRVEASATVNIFVNNIPPEPIDQLYEGVPKNCRDYRIKVFEYVNEFNRMIRDLDNDTLSLVSVGMPKNGTVQLSEDKQSIMFTAEREFRGFVSFEYVITDMNSTANATISLHIENQAPQANEDRFEYRSKDELHYLDVLMNDVDPNGDEIFITDVFNLCAGANAHISQNRSLIIFAPVSRKESMLHPRSMYDTVRFGCSMQYTISDGLEYSTSNAFVTLKNNLPSILSEYFEVPKGGFNSTSFDIAFKDADEFDRIGIFIDPESKHIAKNIELIKDEVGESVPWLEDTWLKYNTSYVLAFTPADNGSSYNTTVKLVINDEYDTSTKEIRIHVFNEPPIARDDIIPIECHKNIPCDINGIMDNDCDPNGDEIAIDSTLFPQESVNGAEVKLIDGYTLLFTPAKNFSGTDIFSYRVTDAPTEKVQPLTSNIAQVSIKVVNDPPVAVADSYNVGKNIEHILTVLENDFDVNGDELFVDAVLGHFQGGNNVDSSVRISSDGKSILYTAPNGEYDDYFFYRVRDSDGEPSNYARVSLNVINLAPSAQNIRKEMHWRQNAPQLLVDISSHASDPNGDEMFISSDLSRMDVTLSYDDERQKLYFFPSSSIPLGTLQFSYTVTDKDDINPLQSTAVIEVIITNNAPTATRVQATRHHSETTTFSPNSKDIDGDAVLLESLEKPLFGNAVNNGDGTATYRFNPDRYSGSYPAIDSFKYTVNDTKLSSTGIVEFTITNSAPVANPDLSTHHWRTAQDSDIYVDVLQNDEDEDGEKDLPLKIIQASKTDENAVGDVSFNPSQIMVKIPSTAHLIWKDQSLNDRKTVVGYTVTDGAETAATNWILTFTNQHRPENVDLFRSGHWRDVHEHGIILDPLNGVSTDRDGDVLALVDLVKLQLGDGALMEITNTGRPRVKYATTKPYKTSGEGDTATVTITDGLDHSIATFTISVTNNPPQAAQKIHREVNWRDFNKNISINILDNGCDDADPQDIPYLRVIGCRVLEEGDSSSSTAYVSNDGRGCLYSSDLFDGKDIVQYTITDGLDFASGTVEVFGNMTYDDKSFYYEEHWTAVRAPEGKKYTETIDELRRNVPNVEAIAISTLSYGNASVIDASTWQYTWPPSVYEKGNQHLELSVSTGGTESMLVDITVHVMNSPPVCRSITFERHWRDLQQNQHSIGIANAASDPDDQDIVLYSNIPLTTTYGTANQDGNILIYQQTDPNDDKDVFSFLATDGLESCTVTASIHSTNTPPRKTDLNHVVHWTSLNDGVIINLLDLHPVDDDRDPLKIVSNDASRTVSDFSIEWVDDNTFNLTHPNPATSVGKRLSFSFFISDTVSQVESSITISVTNTAPIAHKDIFTVPAQDRVSGGRTLDVLNNDVDKDGDEFFIEGCRSLSPGSITISDDKKYLNFIPPQNTFTSRLISFDYRISDGANNSDWANVEVEVTNIAPEAHAKTIELMWTKYNTGIEVDLMDPNQRLCEDKDDTTDMLRDMFDFGEIQTVGNSYGKVSATSIPGKFTFHPNREIDEAAFKGGSIAAHVITYKCRDVAGSTASDTITFNIKNSRPIAYDFKEHVPRTSSTAPFEIDVFNGRDREDADGDTMRIMSVAYGGSYGVVAHTDTHIIFNPKWNEITDLEFEIKIRYTVTDGQRVSEEKTVTIEYGNSAPECRRTPSLDALNKGDSPVWILKDEYNTHDPNGDKYTFSIENLTPELGEITMLDNNVGRVKFTHRPPRSGTFNANIILTDGSKSSKCPLTFSVNNAVPSALDKSYSVIRKTFERVEYYDIISDAVTDRDTAYGDSLILEHVEAIDDLRSKCGGANAVRIAKGMVEYTIPRNHSHPCIIEYRVRDNNSPTPAESETKRITIGSPSFQDLNPVAVPDNFTVKQQEMFYLSTNELLKNDYDLNDDVIEFDAEWFNDNKCKCPDCCLNANVGDAVSGQINFLPSRTKCTSDKFQYRVRQRDQRHIASKPTTVTVTSKDCVCQKPMDLVFSLDSSGSISDAQWKTVKTFVNSIIERLIMDRGVVRVGVVQFSEDAYTGLEGKYLRGWEPQHDKADTLKKLTNLHQKKGNTNIRAGLYAAKLMLERAEKQRNDNHERVVVLITDGDANRPNSCAGCDKIPEGNMSGREYCSAEVRKKRSGNDCNSCNQTWADRVCADPTPNGAALNNSPKTKVISIAITGGISAKFLEVIRNLHYKKELVAIDFNNLESIFQDIVDSACFEG